MCMSAATFSGEPFGSASAAARSAVAVLFTRSSLMTCNPSVVSIASVTSPRTRYRSRSPCVCAIATAAEGVPGWARSQVSRWAAAVSAIAAAKASAGESSVCLTSAPAMCSTNHGTPWIHPVSVRTVAPSRTAAMSAVTTTPSSFGLSGDPGSDAAATCTLRTFRAVNGRNGLNADDLPTVFRVEVARNDCRETPVFQILVQVHDVIGNEMGSCKSSRGVGAS